MSDDPDCCDDPDCPHHVDDRPDWWPHHDWSLDPLLQPRPIDTIVVRDGLL